MNKLRKMLRKSYGRSYLDSIEFGLETSESATMNVGMLGAHFKDGDDGSNGGGSGNDDGGDGGDDGGNGSDGGNDDDKGGKGPSDAEAKLTKEMMKWKGKARETETSLAGVKTQLEEIQNVLGSVSLDDIGSLIQGKKDAETKALSDKGDYDAALELVKGEHASTVEQMKKAYTESTDAGKIQLEELTASLASAAADIDRLTVGTAFTDSAFVKDKSALPLSIVRNQFGPHFSYEDGKVVGYDKPNGVEGRVPLVDATGANKSFEDAIQTLFEGHSDATSLIKSTQKPGGNSGGDFGKKSGSEDGGKPLKGKSRIAAALEAS